MNASFQCSDGGKPSEFKERKDCTVRATAICLEIPYEVAHARLKELGRKDKRGIHFRDCYEALGLEIMPEFSCMSLKRVLPSLKQGRYIVKVAHHVFAVVDGTIHDKFLTKETKHVKMVYKPKIYERKIFN